MPLASRFRRVSARVLFLALSGWMLCGACLWAAERKTSAVVGPSETPEQRIRHDVEVLASPAFMGRALGTGGAERAADFIQTRFQDLGLRPPPHADYRQTFPVRLRVKVSKDAGQNEFTLGSPTSAQQLELHRDFLPLPFSGQGRVRNAPLVFAGYAMHAPELGYDDFAGVDVQGKVVVALRREPQEEDTRSRFAGRDFTLHASLAAKAQTVARRGGKALVLVTNRLPREENTDLPVFPASAGPVELPIPVVMVRASALESLFTQHNANLTKLAQSIDSEGVPHSFAFPSSFRSTLAVRLQGVNAKGTNVMAWVPGHPDSNEYVVVGAHHDHVGSGENYSLDNSGRGKLHPGADDNASGIAALLELARTLSAERPEALPAGTRGVLLVAYGGEEHGLFGSSYLLRNLPLPGKKLVGAMNFDMVGRLRESELFQAGLDSVPELKDTFETAASRAGLTLKSLSEYPYNMSDHGSFLDIGIPAILLFTGLHLEYHTPRDTADRVNVEGIVTMLGVAQSVLENMRSRSTSLVYVPGANPGYQRQWTESTLPSNAFDYE